MPTLGHVFNANEGRVLYIGTVGRLFYLSIARLTKHPLIAGELLQTSLGAVALSRAEMLKVIRASLVALSRDYIDDDRPIEHEPGTDKLYVKPSVLADGVIFYILRYPQYILKGGIKLDPERTMKLVNLIWKSLLAEPYIS